MEDRLKRFKVFTSNRLEILIEMLATILKTPLKSITSPEIIVVQSKGIERWVSMELARYHGICANVRFPFPNAFVEEYFRKALPDIPEKSLFTPEIITWQIMRLIPSFIKNPDTADNFKILKHYLLEDYLEESEVSSSKIKSLKLYQLSERIADTFDQYIIFRPKMISEWESGNANSEEIWQSILWREIFKQNKGMHREAILKRFEEQILNKPDIHGLPERISVFGISYLPEFHLRVFKAISKFTEVNLFLMNPCKEYWEDIRSKRQIYKAISSNNEIDANALHFEEGNPLLASMGTLARNFLGTIVNFVTIDNERFEDPGEDSLLNCIQSDILNLQDRKDNKTHLDKNDNSIQIHSCHSPMREIEVLHDYLLNMFSDKNLSLTPSDIIVMSPNIEIYAPYIQAVFDSYAYDDKRRIPFAIADRSIRKESRIVETFMAILDLVGGRFGASQVLSILESRSVYEKFELSEKDLDLIRHWVKETRIRWGIDAHNRKGLDLPELPENTWKSGIDRMLLGYAMPHNDKGYKSIIPYDLIEGSATNVLGHFINFTDRLFKFALYGVRQRKLSEWSNTLKNLLENFFINDDDTEYELQNIHSILNALSETESMSKFENTIELNVIKSYLSDRFKKQGFGFGFITGGVTFCTMLPMRSIPFKVICLIGMNSDSYPRRHIAPGFDLMAKHPLPNDRDIRKDDRYLFLEAILSARNRLYISFVGQSIKDNSIIPPSVLVSELLDYIEKGFEINDECKMINDEKEKTERDFHHSSLIIRHRLQAFSPAYFTPDNKKLFSYSVENCEAAKCLQSDRINPKPFISDRISEPDEQFKTIDVDTLCKFFDNPAKFLLNQRLGIFLESQDFLVEEKELFFLDGLDKYWLGQDLVEKEMNGDNIDDYILIKKSLGELPHGTVGLCAYETLNQDAKNFVSDIKKYVKDNPLDPINIDIPISDFRLIGTIKDIYPGNLIRYRFAKISSKDYLRAWIHHLVLNLKEYPKVSIIIGKDNVCSYEPIDVEDAKKILEKYLNIYWNGLIKPLHFFPKSSWEYALSVIEKSKPDTALQNAKKEWLNNYNKTPEIKNEYFNLCFGQIDPLDNEFQKLSVEIFEPLIKNRILLDA